MSDRSRLAMVSLAIVLVVGIALGLGVVGRPTASSPAPSGSAASSATIAGTTPSAEPSPSESTVPASESDAVPSGPGVTWSRLSPEGVAPAARQGATWTVDPSSGIAYLYGGITSASVGRPLDGGATLGDLWAYDLAADSWEPVVGTSDEPPPRSGHVAAWVEDVGLLVVGGRGGDGKALGDVWRFDPGTGAWSRIAVSGTVPPGRFDACGASPGDGTFWLTHGANLQTQFDDTWRLDLARRHWTRIARTDRPSSRSAASCWVDAAGRFVLYGGDGGGKPLGDLWVTSAGSEADATWTRLAGPGPFPPRSGAAAAIHLDRAVLVGGLGTRQALRDDVAELGPTDDALRPLPPDGSPPPARASAVLVDDPADERMLLYGGVTADGVAADLWSAELR